MGKAKDADKKFMTAPEGEKEKTHPKRPRKEGLTRWHRFSLIRQREGGGRGRGLKAETPGEPRGDGAKVEKNKPPGTLMETLSSGMRCKRGRSRRLAETGGQK